MVAEIIKCFTAQKYNQGNNWIKTLTVQAKTPALVEQAIEEVKIVIHWRHGEEPFYRISSVKEQLDFYKRVISIFELLVLLISSVALVVGGIGILNIMMVSVFERVPEIGLRKSLGAKDYQIRLQFLTESILICLITSGLGLLIGSGVGQVVAWGATRLSSDYFGLEWPSILTWQSIAVAFVTGTSIGVSFGYYPASQAAKIAPIEALRNS